MPSNPDSSFHFRDVEFAEFYDRNFGRQQRYLAAKRDVERYRFILEQALVSLDLTENDAIAIWHALNGCNTSHTKELNLLKSAVIDGLEDSPVPVERYGLSQKIANMSMAEWLAVVDACERVGGGAYQVDNLVEELKRVGINYPNLPDG